MNPNVSQSLEQWHLALLRFEERKVLYAEAQQALQSAHDSLEEARTLVYKTQAELTRVMRSQTRLEVAP